LKKSLLFVTMTMLMVLLLTGCMGNTVKPSVTVTPKATASAVPSATPTASPSAMPTEMPSASPESSLTPGATDASPAPSDAPMGNTYDTEALRTEVEKLSEVKTAVVAAMGTKALVGITFDPAYQGTLTDRIVEMVGEQITEKEKGITEVAVTSDPEQISQIEALSKGTSPEKERFEQLFAQIKPSGSNKTEK